MLQSTDFHLVVRAFPISVHLSKKIFLRFMAIRFYSDYEGFDLNNESMLKKWINAVVCNHGKKSGTITYLFCDDERIARDNVQFLNHDTYTDIITFDYVEGNLVSGDILISLDRVGENAHQFGCSFERELHRVVIHGVLHLLGFKDKTDADAAQMRLKEEESLKLLDAMR